MLFVFTIIIIFIIIIIIAISLASLLLFCWFFMFWGLHSRSWKYCNWSFNCNLHISVFSKHCPNSRIKHIIQPKNSAIQGLIALLLNVNMTRVWSQQCFDWKPPWAHCALCFKSLAYPACYTWHWFLKCTGASMAAVNL